MAHDESPPLKQCLSLGHILEPSVQDYRGPEGRQPPAAGLSSTCSGGPKVNLALKVGVMDTSGTSWQD